MSNQGQDVNQFKLKYDFLFSKIVAELDVLKLMRDAEEKSLIEALENSMKMDSISTFGTQYSFTRLSTLKGKIETLEMLLDYMDRVL